MEAGNATIRPSPRDGESAGYSDQRTVSEKPVDGSCSQLDVARQSARSRGDFTQRADEKTGILLRLGMNHFLFQFSKI